MPNARRLVVAVVSTLLAASAFAQHEHALSPEQLRALAASLSRHGAILPQPESVVVNATKQFTITARQFDFSPATFTVNQGDVVQLTVNVPSNDGSTVGHGIFMDTYVDFTNIARGQSKTFQFTASTPGMFGFVCTQSSCGNGHSNMVGFMTVLAPTQPAPTITSLNPTSGSNLGGTSVTITGTNFQVGATVSFGGTAATSATTTSSTTIVTTAPAHALGSVPVTVTNPDNQTVTRANAFTYVVPPPTITSVTPSSGPTSGGTAVTITGTNFQSGATVTFGASAATNVVVVSATQITAKTPLGPANEQVGMPVNVSVTNPDGTNATKSGAFTYTVPPLAVTSVSPSTGSPSGGTQITISGAGFTTALASSVTIGGVAATNVQVIDAVTMRATTPAHAEGSANVVVTVGATSATLTNGFTYATPSPKRRAVRH